MRSSTWFLILAVLPTLTIQISDTCAYYEEWAHDVSEPCLKQLGTVCRNSNLTAKMVDAGSQLLIPGMSYSNVIDYGNYPECLTIDYVDIDGRILGKFCGLSTIIVNVLLTSETTKIFKDFGIDTRRNVVPVSRQTFSMMEPQLRDILLPDVPFVLSKYSSCIPDKCTPKEVGKFFLVGNSINFGNTSVSLIMYTEDLIDMPCETVNSNTDFYWGDVLFILMLVFIGILIIISTIYDALCQNFGVKPHHPLLLAFSVIYNGKKLLVINPSTPEQIECFNGMRFISMMWVMAYHAGTPFQGGVIALENFPDVKTWEQKWTARYILSGVLSVDTFFFISGFLLAFSYIRSHLNKPPVEQLKKVPKMYLHRYLRLTPAAGVMFLTTVTIYRFMGNGPTWTFLTSYISDACTSKWWKFFLYIQNYTDPDDMCLLPTWYLSADMQMFILAPLVMIPTATFIQKKYRETLYALGFLTFLSVLIPMLLRYYADKEPGNIYTTHERFTNFLIGVMLGAVMRLKKNHKFIFNSWANLGLWVVVIIASLAFNIYWSDVLNNYEFLKYTLFNGFYRLIWCLCLCFMVYSCYHHQGGVIEWFLSRPSFQILSRLSYCMYVLHYIVEVYAAGTLKVPLYFSNYFLFYNFCGHIIVTMFFATLWVLAFEFPMLTIDKYLLG